jgi:hypothetical protein
VGSSTTPLQDEQRHMAPPHHLAAGLSDEGDETLVFAHNRMYPMREKQLKSRNYREAV